MLKHQYIFFDAGRSKHHVKIDKDEYFYISTSELRSIPEITMISYPLDYSSFFRILYVLTTKICSKVKALSFLKRIWFPFYFKNGLHRDDNVCFIVYGYYIKPDYLRYLKKKYENCIIIKIHRDSYKNWRKRNPEFSEEDMENLFDMSFSYDVGDSQKYGMIHFDDFCSKVDDIKKEEFPIHDIFFAGAAKDRMVSLIEMYDYLDSLGIQPYFYITNCPSQKRVFRDGIYYADDYMSYRDMLYHTINSKVILEVNQVGVDGYTSRFIESILYGKKLITNNKAVKKSKFYDKNRMICYEKVEDICYDFFEDNDCIEYEYNGEFSPICWIKMIDRIVCEKDIM